MANPPARVGVLFGGPSPEHDVSVLTGLQAARTLAGDPRVSECHTLYWSKTGSFFEVSPKSEGAAFASGPPPGAEAVELSLGPEGGFKARQGKVRPRLENLGIEALLVCCHGGPGEDGALQGALDLAGVPYSGPSAMSAAIGMDKLASYALATAAGLPTLPRLLLQEDGKDPDFPGPYILKPRYGGSSIGIEVVADLATARDRWRASVHFRRGAVLEPYRPELYDVQIGVRSWPGWQLSAIERPVRATAGAEILGYADKYVGGEGMASAPRELPADLPEAVTAELRAAAGEAASILGVRGVARIDFLSDGQALYLNEVNTIPGSLARYLFIDPPLRFNDLLVDLLTEAVERPATYLSSAGSDGAVLRQAGSIAAKLA